MYPSSGKKATFCYFAPGKAKRRIYWTRRFRLMAGLLACALLHPRGKEGCDDGARQGYVDRQELDPYRLLKYEHADDPDHLRDHDPGTETADQPQHDRNQRFSSGHASFRLTLLAAYLHIVRPARHATPNNANAFTACSARSSGSPICGIRYRNTYCSSISPYNSPPSPWTRHGSRVPSPINTRPGQELDRCCPSPGAPPNTPGLPAPPPPPGRPAPRSPLPLIPLLPEYNQRTHRCQVGTTARRTRRCGC